MSNDFRDRMLAATKVLRGRELELKKQIGAIYASCARDMEKEILKYGADSLAGRRAVTLQKSMRGYVKRLWREVHATAERAARDGAEIGIGIQTSLLDDALHGFGISTRASFAGAFGHTQDEAVAAVLNGSVYKGKRVALSKRIWNNEALQGGQIERLIAEATAQGHSAVELAKDLTAYINPDARMPDHWNEIYPMPFVYKTDYNAKRLAVTTLNHGYYQGMIMAARENPFAEYLHWELSSFHTIYDVCDLYMEHDEGLGLGNFALDSPDLPLPHPFCRCNYYIDSDKSLKEIGQEIGGWISGEENPRLDAAFAEWKKEYTFGGESGILRQKNIGGSTSELSGKEHRIFDEKIRGAQSTRDLQNLLTYTDLDDNIHSYINDSFSLVPLETQKELVEGIVYARDFLKLRVMPTYYVGKTKNSKALAEFNEGTQIVTFNKSLLFKFPTEAFGNAVHETAHYYDQCRGYPAESFFKQAVKYLGLRSNSREMSNLKLSTVGHRVEQMNDVHELLAFSIEKHARHTGNDLSEAITAMVRKEQLMKYAPPSKAVEAEIDQLFKRWNIEYPGDEPELDWAEFVEKFGSDKVKKHFNNED